MIANLIVGVYEAIIPALVTARRAELAMEYYKEMVSKGIEIVNFNLYELFI